MSLHGGTAVVDITPPVGLELSGCCFGPSTGVADPLFARTLILSDGGPPLVVITADLIGLGTVYANRIRDAIAARLATRRERVLIACSHTHSGPGTMPLRRWGPVDESYVEELIDRIVLSADDARSALEPVTLSAGTGEVRGINQNRRGDGGNLTDDEVPVIVVADSKRDPVAIIYSVACHPVAAHNDGQLISADFPGYAAETVNTTHPRAVPMFLLGAAGDINPVEFHSLDLARKYGRVIGAELLSVTDAAKPPTATTLDAVSTTVELPVAPLPDLPTLEKELARWSAEAQRLETEGGAHSKIEDARIKAEWAEAARDVVRADAAVAALEMEIVAVRIGDVALVVVPGEPFVQIGLTVRRDSPFAQTIVIGLANGSLSYLPTSDAFSTGGYETDFSAKVYGLYMLTAAAQGIVERCAHALPDQLQTNQSQGDTNE